jgi:hypothetical protein
MQLQDERLAPVEMGDFARMSLHPLHEEGSKPLVGKAVAAALVEAGPDDAAGQRQERVGRERDLGQLGPELSFVVGHVVELLFDIPLVESVPALMREDGGFDVEAHALGDEREGEVFTAEPLSLKLREDPITRHELQQGGQAGRLRMRILRTPDAVISLQPLDPCEHLGALVGIRDPA